LSKWSRSSTAAIADQQFWLLSRADYERLAARPGVRLQLDYSLSLLSPANSIDIATDAQRRFFAGMGYCGARFHPDVGQVAVDCFKPGAQPALLFAHPQGAPLIAGRPNSVTPNYVPAPLDFLGGKRYGINFLFKGDQPPRVTVTSYAARAHFERRLTIPGVLGGSATACPAPR
jgi:hypothetical protein